MSSPWWAALSVGKVVPILSLFAAIGACDPLGGKDCKLQVASFLVRVCAEEQASVWLSGDCSDAQVTCERLPPPIVLRCQVFVERAGTCGVGTVVNGLEYARVLHLTRGTHPCVEWARPDGACAAVYLGPCEAMGLGPGRDPTSCEGGGGAGGIPVQGGGGSCFGQGAQGGSGGAPPCGPPSRG
jgi:hypothetical protein